MLKNIVGVVVSALIVLVLYLGPGLLGILYTMMPQDLIADLVLPDRQVVYEGAWEISDFEREGDIDGEIDHVVDVTLPAAGKAQDAATGDGTTDEVLPDAEPGGGESEAPAGDSLAQVKPGGPRAVKGKGKGTGTGTGGGIKRPETRENGNTRSKSRFQCPKTFDGITKRANGIYEVDRSLVNYHTASVKQFNELGWSKSNDTGDKKGWFVSGFDCKGPLWHAGFRRGDIVLTVNGKRTNNMMQILLLYSKVKAQKHFAVEIRRKGQELTLNYVVVH